MTLPCCKIDPDFKRCEKGVLALEYPGITGSQPYTVTFMELTVRVIVFVTCIVLVWARFCVVERKVSVQNFGHP